MLLDQLTDTIDLFAAESVAALQPNGIEPELRFTVVPLNVDVRWLTAIPSVEEEPERAYSEYGRHADMLYGTGAKNNVFAQASRDDG